MQLNTLHPLDALTLLRALPDASVDVIISDPPYHTTQLHYDRAPMIDWAAWWREANRVVKPTGMVVLFADGLFTIDLILTNRKQYRYRLVWEKTSATGFLDANRRPLKAHEDILIFCRTPRTSTYNPQKTATGKQQGAAPRSNYAAAHYGQMSARGEAWQEDGTRFPRSVLRFGSVKKQQCQHPNQKPEDLLRWLVRTYTNPGQIVLDTFAGSATTAVACLAEGRKFICCEVDVTYYTKAQARIAAAQADLFQPA